MKKYFLLSAVAIIFFATGMGQSKEKKLNAPDMVKQAFAKNFPGAIAKWEKEGAGYEANFKTAGHEMSAVFDANGTMTESETEITVSELPSTVLTYVKTNYKGVKINEAAKITKSNGEMNYEAEVKGKDLIFDANGKFLKEVKD